MFVKYDRFARRPHQYPRRRSATIVGTITLTILAASGVALAQVAPPMDASVTRSVATGGPTLGDRYRSPAAPVAAPAPLLSPAVGAATLGITGEWRPTPGVSTSAPTARVARTAPQWLGQVKSWVHGVDGSGVLPPPPWGIDAQTLLSELLQIPGFAAYYAERPAPIPSRAGEERAYLHLVTLASRFIASGTPAAVVGR